MIKKLNNKDKEPKVLYEEEPTEQKLTKRQELFCHNFAQDKDCFGIGVRAYLKVYPDCSYDSARTCAYRLLTNVYIMKRIDDLMEVFINDQIVDKELARVISQMGDYSSKVRAISEYNKVKGRIVERRDVTIGGRIKLDDIGDNLLDKLNEEDNRTTIPEPKDTDPKPKDQGDA